MRSGRVTAAIDRSRGNCAAVLTGLLMVLSPIGKVLSADQSHLYITWVGSEPDKGASAWYIKRHVDPLAVFQTAPQGSLFDVGIPFDTPQARYRRTQSASTLESLLLEHPTSDPAIVKLGLLMHDIEINIWQPKRFPESSVLEMRAKELGAAYGEQGPPMACFIALFDNVYAWLRTVPHDPASLVIPRRCNSGGERLIEERAKGQPGSRGS